jgi:putative membrane protein
MSVPRSTARENLDEATDGPAPLRPSGIRCTVLAEEHEMMYGYGLNGAGGWWMLAAMAIVAIAIVASVWLIVHRPGTPSQSRSSAEEILRERFARGEITGEQFDDAKKRLG